MLTVRATLEPDGRVRLSESVKYPTSAQVPLQVLVTFLDPLPDESPTVEKDQGTVAGTLALLASTEFRNLPCGDAAEIEDRIEAMRQDWDER